MIAEGPEGELSAVPIIAATATVAPYAMVAPSAATPTSVAITPSATPAPTSSVEQSNAVDAPSPQASGEVSRNSHTYHINSSLTLSHRITRTSRRPWPAQMEAYDLWCGDLVF